MKWDSLGRRTDRVNRREAAQIQKLYVDGLGQQEIAKRLRRDRRTVSKFLVAPPSENMVRREVGRPLSAESTGDVPAVLEMLSLSCVPNQSPYVQREVVTKNGETVLAMCLLRLGVTGPKHKTVEDVEVLIEAFTPQGAPFLPQALHPMRSSLPGQGDSVFSIHPGATEYVDFVRLHLLAETLPTDVQPPFLSLGYHQTFPNLLAVKDYEFVVVARGKHIPETRRIIRVHVEPNALVGEFLV